MTVWCSLGRCIDQGRGGGGDGASGEPELCCTVGAEGDPGSVEGGPAVQDGGGDGAEGEPELSSTVCTEGEPGCVEGAPAAPAVHPAVAVVNWSAKGSR